MTKLLQRAFEEASKLPEGEQDALLVGGPCLRAAMGIVFSGSHDLLHELADQALAEHRVTKLCEAVER